MNSNEYELQQISNHEAETIATQYFGLIGKASVLPGEIDFNFKIITQLNEKFILKISRPSQSEDYSDFQEKLLIYLEEKGSKIPFPKIRKTLIGEYFATFNDKQNNPRKVRVLDWIEGRLWNDINPQTDDLGYCLGEIGGQTTKLLQDFNHSFASRKFDWDIANVRWTYEFQHLFSEQQRELVQYFIAKFEGFVHDFADLRKSVIHNDANENNILVNGDLQHPKVITVIDFGDAVYSQTINDLAVALCYAIMDLPDPLAAAMPIVAGYHKQFALTEKELEMLYTLVAMRLIISVSKSAINKVKEPENKYLFISEKPAWELLQQWKNIPERLVYYAFRMACGMEILPIKNAFSNWAKSQVFTVKEVFPTLEFDELLPLDLSIGSSFLGNFENYTNDIKIYQKVLQFQALNADKLPAGGYLEARPFYSTKAFEIEGNNGTEYRSYHLGVDFWQKEGTAIHAFYDGEVFAFANNKANKDYGPVIILKHTFGENQYFYTLYGHLSTESLDDLKIGKTIKKCEKIGTLGNVYENGGWPPHLHFQIMLDLLELSTEFPGVGSPSLLPLWSAICPDPNLLFKNKILENEDIKNQILDIRKKHLGKNLSLSYAEPLTMLRGEMQYLIDATGRRYLDTVNNVAHVGHEHPRVVEAGQKQMAVLNTNTRYLHENITKFAAALCETLPKELSVIYLVNSGSEANELALRMAKTITKQKDIIALEVGYHGNTQGCIDVSSYKFNGKGGKGKPENTHIVPLPDSFRGIYQGKSNEIGEKYVAHIKEAINYIKEQNRGVAAFIAESIVSCGGQIELPENYLKLAYEFVREAGGLCIADEVQVGFGRVGKAFWGFQLHDVVPDIVTMGKPIGNGHPLAAVACTPAVAQAFANGMEYFNTFGGNPVSAAIGYEVLQVIKEEKLQENALFIGEMLKNELKSLQKDFSIIADVRGQGLFLGFELCEKNKKPATEKTNYLSNRMKQHGVLTSVDGQDNNVIKIKPPMCFNEENVALFIQYLRKILNEDAMRT